MAELSMKRLWQAFGMCCLVLLIGLWCMPAASAAPDDLPANARIADFAGILSDEEIESLNEHCRTLATQHGMDALLITCNDLDEDAIWELITTLYEGSDIELSFAALAVNVDQQIVHDTWYGEDSPDSFAQSLDNFWAIAADEGYSAAMHDYLDGLTGANTLSAAAQADAPASLDTLSQGVMPDATEIMSARAASGRRADTFVYDNQNLLSATQRDYFNARASELYDEYRINFIFYTTSEQSSDDLKYDTEYFHNRQLGMGSDDCCIVYTIAPSIRQFRVDFFGVAREIQPDSDIITDEVVIAMRPAMSDEDYARAADVLFENALVYFDRYIAQVQAEYQQLSQDTTAQMLAPRIGVTLYDPSGYLDDSEAAALSDTLTRTGEALDVRFVAVLMRGIPDSLQPIQIQRFLEAYDALGQADQSAVIFIDVSNQTATYHLSQDLVQLTAPVSDNDWQWDVRERLYYYDDVPGAVDAFIQGVGTVVENARILERLTVPTPDNAKQSLYDYAVALTTEQASDLEKLAAEYGTDDSVHYLLVTCDLEAPWLLDEYFSRFYFNHRSLWPSDTVVLVLDTANGETYTYFYGRARTKMLLRDMERIEQNLWDAVNAGDAYSALAGFLEGTHRAMNTIVPVASMVDDAPEMLQFSVMVGVAVMLIGLLILAIWNKRLHASAPPARSFAVPNSLKINYRKDVFVHSHVSKTARPKESDSSGSSGSSSGGSSSSSGGQSSY